MSKKTKILLTLTGFVAAAAMAIPVVQAAPPQKGDCQQGGWDEILVNDANDPRRARQLDKDGNHDQWICQNPGGNQLDDNDD